MSMQQQFCLRWNNHQPNFISVFSNLLNNETLVDVTLAAEGRHLQAHKVVLSACSTYFQSLFTANPCRHPIVILKDVKFSDLKIMIDFMYYGEVNVSQDQLPGIIKTAETLKIKGLAEMHTPLSKCASGGCPNNNEAGAEGESPNLSSGCPSFRRKRSRRSSTGSGSGEKSEEGGEITLVATNAVKPEPLIAVTQESGDKRTANASTESQGSMDEDQISIISNMGSSATATPVPSEHVQEGTQQSGGNNGTQSSSSQGGAHQGNVPRTQREPTEVKRGARLLRRQSRVKKEPCHSSPDKETVISSIHLNPSQEGRVASQPVITSSVVPSNLLTVPQPIYLVKQHSHPLLPSQQASTTSSSNLWIQRQHSNPEIPGRTSSPSILVGAPIVKIEEDLPEEGKINTDLETRLKTKASDFIRSVSSPHGTSGDERLSHCPVERPGPPLGCNHCWNTIDAHGRILRRKTKFHCPECRINLCIVPCFQQFHERQREPLTMKTLPKTSSI